MRLPGVLVLALCLGDVTPGWTKAISAQATTNPAPVSHGPASSVPPPAKAPAKTPAEPIDPDATAGVRGAGFALKVQVTFKAKPVVGAFVLARNPDRSVAAPATPTRREFVRSAWERETTRSRLPRMAWSANVPRKWLPPPKNWQSSWLG